MNPQSFFLFVSSSLSALRTQTLRSLPVLAFLLFASLSNPAAHAQTTGRITGIITDPSGAVIQGATISVKNTETGATRTTSTNASGQYFVLDLSVGEYRVTASNPNFREAGWSVKLIVNQEARVDLTLQVGANAGDVVKASGDAPMVSTSTSDVSGLVGEQAIKNLPLNGRSYDLLLTLNPGIVNFTSQKTGGTGISNSTTANNFAVNGNRPQQNLFLLNGVEYTGAAENNMTPGGASGQLLGVDGVREFNLLRDAYSSEYGKHPGGQVIIVTQAGTNLWHGSLFEFLRNSALDSRDFFDVGSSPPPFRRNQFGGSVGGPIRKDKTFLFLNYEGFRQSLHQTSDELVPDAKSRADAAPIVQQLGLLNLWPAAPANAPDF